MATCFREIDFILNGQSVRAAGIPAQTTLLDYLRDNRYTGAKEGCAEGECGACAVLLVSDDVSGSRYRAVNSCLVPLPAVAGREVITVEGLAPKGEVCEVQRAMIEQGGSQCGYCTPGFVVSMFAEQYRPGTATSREVYRLGGNLCRCTGYRPIRAAFESLGAPTPGPLLERLRHPAPKLQAVEYGAPSGRFSRPTTLKHLFELRAADPAAVLVAGNTDLGVLTNLRGERFAHLVSVEAVPEMREFRETQEYVEIGAALTLAEVGERWTTAPRLIGEWLDLFASPLIRNRATLGGNLCTASPIGDSAPLLLALDAAVRIVSPEAERILPLNEFFVDYRKTALRRDELLRAIRIPLPLARQVRFYKVAKRALDDISTVAAAFAVDQDSHGVVRRARIAFGGVAAVPLRAADAEQALVGTRLRKIDIENANRMIARAVSPMSDHRGSVDYRRAVSMSLLEKFHSEAGQV
jgi:xanthine dehydrogenase small subunit